MEAQAAWAHVKSALEQTSNCCDAGQGVERWIKDLYEAKEEEAAAAAASGGGSGEVSARELEARFKDALQQQGGLQSDDRGRTVVVVMRALMEQRGKQRSSSSRSSGGSIDTNPSWTMAELTAVLLKLGGEEEEEEEREQGSDEPGGADEMLLLLGRVAVACSRRQENIRGCC